MLTAILYCSVLCMVLYLPFHSLPKHAVVCFSTVFLIDISHIQRYPDFFANMASNMESKVIT